MKKKEDICKKCCPFNFVTMNPYKYILETTNCIYFDEFVGKMHIENDQLLSNDAGSKAERCCSNEHNAFMYSCLSILITIDSNNANEITNCHNVH